jgi:hypothetical protein
MLPAPARDLDTVFFNFELQFSVLISDLAHFYALYKLLPFYAPLQSTKRTTSGLHTIQQKHSQTNHTKFRISHLDITRMRLKPIAIAAVTAVLTTTATAGPAAYGICQAGCAVLVMGCYSAAGYTRGATLGASAPVTILACNSAIGTCNAACWAAIIAPIGHCEE